MTERGYMKMSGSQGWYLFHCPKIKVQDWTESNKRRTPNLLSHSIFSSFSLSLKFFFVLVLIPLLIPSCTFFSFHRPPWISLFFLLSLHIRKPSLWWCPWAHPSLLNRDFFCSHTEISNWMSQVSEKVSPWWWHSPHTPGPVISSRVGQHVIVDRGGWGESNSLSSL